MHIIPTSVVDAFAQNNLLQVLLFAILFGVALASFSESAPPVLMEVLDQALHVIFRVVGYIMYLAPLGAFGAMAFTVGNYGAGSLKSFGMLILACYGAALLFIVLLSIVVKLITGVNAWKFVKYCRAEFMLALGTGSSEAVMPRIIKKLDNAGCDRAVVGLVIPTGYSFNLDGAAIYLSLAMMFLAQAVGVDLGFGQQLAIMGILILSSKGMAGVPGSAFVALSATAAAIGAFPVAAVALLLGADRLMDSMRVFTESARQLPRHLCGRQLGGLARQREDAGRPRREGHAGRPGRRQHPPAPGARAPYGHLLCTHHHGLSSRPGDKHLRERTYEPPCLTRGPPAG